MGSFFPFEFLLDRARAKNELIKTIYIFFLRRRKTHSGQKKKTRGRNRSKWFIIKRIIIFIWALQGAPFARTTHFHEEKNVEKKRRGISRASNGLSAMHQPSERSWRQMYASFPSTVIGALIQLR